jgi:ABC-type branched-subunit amino acid transport system substrate-binding protein
MKTVGQNHALSASVVAWVLSLLGGCVAPHVASGGGVPIGVLLPFSGSAAADGPRAERGLIMAVKDLNQLGGVRGDNFRLIVRDPNAEQSRLEAVVDDLLAQGVVAIIGPSQVEFVRRVRDHLGTSRVPYVLAGSVTLHDFAANISPSLFQIAPPAEVVGCALSNRAYGDGIVRLAAVHATDAYSTRFANAAAASFNWYRTAQLGTGVAVPFDQTNHVATIKTLLAFDPDAIMVVGQVNDVATFVQDWVSTGHAVQWYLAPALQSPEFLRNSPPQSLEGATSIAIAVPGSSEAFATAFRARWSGDEPYIDAYFHYDAVILVGLATIAAARTVGAIPTAPQVEPFIQPIATAPGAEISWQRLSDAVLATRAGQDINYTGASGLLSLGPNGTLDATTSLLQVSVVQDDMFSAGEFNPCPVTAPLGL